MKRKKIDAEDIAYALIRLSESEGICDSETAVGFESSNKKDILNSSKGHSFSKFTNEIKKRQMKKDWGDINNDD